MNLSIHEYNVTPDINEKNKFSIQINNNIITYNDIKIENNEILDKINEILLSYKETLLILKNIHHSNYKGGRQKQLSIYCEDICNEKITLIGNTSNTEIAEFYNTFKNKIISLLEN